MNTPVTTKTCGTCGTTWTADPTACPECCGCGPREGCTAPDCSGTPTAEFNWATDLTMDYAEGVERFPFTEDENGNITGYGHQDKATFAAEVNRYDEAANGYPLDEDDQWTADHVYHDWVLLNEDDETLRAVTSTTAGAIPVTTLWGLR